MPEITAQQLSEFIKTDRLSWEWAGRIEALLVNSSEISRRHRIAVELQAMRRADREQLAQEAERIANHAADVEEGAVAGRHRIVAAWLRQKIGE